MNFFFGLLGTQQRCQILEQRIGLATDRTTAVLSRQYGMALLSTMLPIEWGKAKDARHTTLSILERCDS